MTGASCLVGLLQGPRCSFPCSAIILKVASLLVISDLLEQQIIGSSSCSRCFYLVKNTTISGVCQCLSWGGKPQKNRAWKAAAKGLKKLCWAWIFPPVSAEYCMMFYDATGLWKKKLDILWPTISVLLAADFDLYFRWETANFLLRESRLLFCLLEYEKSCCC